MLSDCEGKAPPQMHAHAQPDGENAAAIPKGTPPEAEQVLLRLTITHLELYVRVIQMPLKG